MLSLLQAYKNQERKSKNPFDKGNTYAPLDPMPIKAENLLIDLTSVVP